MCGGLGDKVTDSGRADAYRKHRQGRRSRKRRTHQKGSTHVIVLQLLWAQHQRARRAGARHARQHRDRRPYARRVSRGAYRGRSERAPSSRSLPPPRSACPTRTHPSTPTASPARAAHRRVASSSVRATPTSSTWAASAAGAVLWRANAQPRARLRARRRALAQCRRHRLRRARRRGRHLARGRSRHRVRHSHCRAPATAARASSL